MNKQKGSTLIEVLVAVSIIALVLTSIGAMITMSIRLADSNEQKQLALQKAQEAIEFFRKERSINSWLRFSSNLNNSGVYCVSSLPVSIASMSAKLGSCSDSDILEAAKYEFKRQAAINFNGSDSLSVEIDINWIEGSKTKNLSLQQNFENY